MINKEIIELINSGVNVVTPTQGLAHHLQTEYAAQQLEQGRLSWPTPSILSWHAWCHTLWQRLVFNSDQHPVLLSQLQSLLLWQQVIESSRYAKQLLQIPATARQAQAAYTQFKHWQLHEIAEDYFINQDAFAFKVWMESYELKLRANSWLDETNLIDYLEQHCESLTDKPDRVVFYAFDQWLPQQTQFINTLNKQGTDVSMLDASNVNSSVGVLNFQDEKTEIRAVGNWIIDCHKKNPAAKIGVVVPNIRSKRQRLFYELEKILSINTLLSGSDQSQLPFTISIGKPLIEYPMIRVALNLLRLNSFRIDVHLLSVILRSPFIEGYNQEVSRRCLLDSRIKRLGQPEIRFETLIHIHDQLAEKNQSPIFISNISKLIEVRQTYSQQESLQEWSRKIYELLKCVSWPGNRVLSSDEHQTFEAWQSSLDKLASMVVVTRVCSYQVALKILQNICMETGFQPQTENKPVQVMGVSGASGMQFDYCWFLGLYDQVWPTDDKPNPFIPIQCQREAGIPNATPTENLELARQLTVKLVSSAKEVVLSYPRRDDDRDLRPSPILKQFSNQSDTINIRDNFAKRIYQQRRLDTFYDESGAVIAKGDLVNGGAALFKDQAACPFRAYAKHRLAAVGLDSTEIGLAAIDRGILVHRALQLFWQTMKHSEQLRRASDLVLNQRIDESVNKAIKEHSRNLSETFNQRFTEIEHQRLVKLLSEWLSLESNRTPFTVEATEKGHHVMFNNITLHMRIDRIDKLSDGRLVIIDYKTGDASFSSWFGDRPKDPQLPLYAITSEGQIAALAFAKVKSGEIRFIGQSETDELLPGIKVLDQEQWSANITEWRENLTQLSDEFCSGKATVDPMPKACRYCDLPTLCRINERIDILEVEGE